MQTLIDVTDTLLDENGRLKHRGYAPYPILKFNPETLFRSRLSRLNRLRLKQWDYYGVTGPDVFFSVCVADLGYMGLVFAYLIDFNRRTVIDDATVTPLGWGCHLPCSSTKGDVRFRSRRVQLAFLREKGRRRIEVSWKRFGSEHHLTAGLQIHQPDEHQGIVMATPIDDTGFYYNHKINCLPTEGFVRAGERRIDFSHQNTLTCLDWGRGVWPYTTFWIWANASGFLAPGSTLGINLGYGFGDLSAATENAFFIDGKLSKLEWVDIQYDPNNPMKPWRFSSRYERCDLTFVPFFRRRSNINLLLLRSHVNQMFGTYRGTLTDESGVTYDVDDIIGWAEDHHARW